MQFLHITLMLTPKISQPWRKGQIKHFSFTTILYVCTNFQTFGACVHSSTGQSWRHDCVEFSQGHGSGGGVFSHKVKHKNKCFKDDDVQKSVWQGKDTQKNNYASNKCYIRHTVIIYTLRKCVYLSLWDKEARGDWRDSGKTVVTKSFSKVMTVCLRLTW